MNYIITDEELTSLEKTGNPSYRKSVDYVIGRIRSRPVEPRQVMPDLERVRSEGWISVKERLPDKNIAVIVHISSGDIDVRVLGICDDDPNGLWYCCKGADEPLRFNEVTHWRPLPEPPRGE